MHGIFHQFLQLYGRYVGLSPGFTISDVSNLHLLFTSILRKQLLKYKKGTELLEHYSFYELQDIVTQYILHIKKYTSHRPFNKEEILTSFKEKQKELMELNKTNKKELAKLKEQEVLLPLLTNLPSQLQILGSAVQSAWQQKTKTNSSSNF